MLGGIQSGTSHGIDGTAPGCRDAWPGQDGSWARISGHWPILWELLSHAVWRRTDGVGSTYGHASGFISVKNSHDVIITSAVASLWLTEIIFKMKTLFLYNLLYRCWFSIIYASQVLKSNCTPLFLSSLMCSGDNLFQLIGNFAFALPVQNLAHHEWHWYDKHGLS